MKLKTKEQIQQLVKDKKIFLIDVSDDGEVGTYQIPTKGGNSTLFSVHYSDFGSEYQIVHHARPIAVELFKAVELLFEE